MRRPVVAATLLATALALLPPVGALTSAHAATTTPHRTSNEFWQYLGAYPTRQAAETEAAAFQRGRPWIHTKIERDAGGGGFMWLVYYHEDATLPQPPAPPGNLEPWHYYGSYRTKAQAGAEAAQLVATHPGTRTHITGPPPASGAGGSPVWVLYVQ